MLKNFSSENRVLKAPPQKQTLLFSSDFNQIFGEYKSKLGQIMGEISPQISNPFTSCSEFTGQNYPLRGQGFRHEGRELIDRSDFTL